VLETLRQLPDTLADESSVLPLEVSPAAHQARRQMLQLRKLDLQLSLEAARALRKNIENQTGTIEYATTEFFLEIAFLAWIKRRRRNNELCLAFFDQRAEFVEFSLADEIPRIRTTT
jgi:hypothetical protein